MKAKPGDQRGAFAFHPAFVEKAEAPRFATEKQILGHAKVRSQRQFLMNDANAKPGRIRGRSDANDVAIDQNSPRVRCVNAAKRIDERGFAGTVFAEQS